MTNIGVCEPYHLCERMIKYTDALNDFAKNSTIETQKHLQNCHFYNENIHHFCFTLAFESDWK